ncbi:cytochrome P450 [Dentipellis sp. KUC8613]|nr:cytochrome P450 [Dentipellis sp. KUC8613]
MDVFTEGSPRAIALAIALACVTLLVLRRRRWSQGLPPSPAGGLPLIGHLHLMPPVRPWVWFDSLSRQLNSPIIHLNLAGQETIVINDYETAVELLDKRSSIYSSRPRLVLAGDYVGTGKRIINIAYGTPWRHHRAAFHQEMVPAKIQSYTHIQVAEARLLMQALLHSPSSFMKHFQQYSGNVLLKITYGLDSDDQRTQKAVADVNEVMEKLLAVATPGNLVDIFPILDRLPDVFSPWRPAILRQQAHNQTVYKGLLHDVLSKVDAGLLRPEQTFASRVWHDREKLKMDELDVAYLAGSMFEAGTETTSSALSIFIMAMVTYPEVFKAAQDEVTRVCENQPPTIDNFEALEYVRATCKEVLRWRAVSAMGFPHKSSATKDDVFMGYVIPAGCVVIANLWGMSLSEKTFGQKYSAQIFEPRRWIERPGGVGDITEDLPAFGFGRRICPGRQLAVNSLLISIAHICYYFDIKAAEGAQAVDTGVEGFTTGLNIEPKHFECSIVPREGRQADIEAQAEAAKEALRGL